MIHWQIIKGVGARNTVTCKTTGGTAVALSGAENFTCTYWTGEDQTAGGSLTWAYNTLAAGTVDITVSATVAALAAGVYQWVLQLPDASAAYARGSFEIVAGPGSATATVTPYCSYNDVLNYAPWCQLVANNNTDLAGLLDRRILARQWLDSIIIRSWRGTSQAYFGDSGRTAQFWMGGWVRRTPLQSQWLTDYISGTNVGGANKTLIQALIIRPWVIRVTAYRTIQLVGQAQIGINNQYAVYGRVAGEMAAAEVLGQSAEIDIAQTGIAQFGIPLAAANTLFT